MGSLFGTSIRICPSSQGTRPSDPSWNSESSPNSEESAPRAWACPSPESGLWRRLILAINRSLSDSAGSAASSAASEVSHRPVLSKHVKFNKQKGNCRLHCTEEFTSKSRSPDLLSSSILPTSLPLRPTPSHLGLRQRIHLHGPCQGHDAPPRLAVGRQRGPEAEGLGAADWGLDIEKESKNGLICSLYMSIFIYVQRGLQFLFKA